MEDKMPRNMGMLSSRRVATAKPKRGRKALVIADGGNLYLQCVVGKDGGISRSWVFRFGLDGKRREMGVGPTHTVSLAEARDKARSLRQQLLDGIDPLEARETARRARIAEAAKAMTFRQCAEAYIKLHGGGWGREHSRQWDASLRTYVLPRIGDVPVRDIDQAMVMRIIEPIWTTKTVTASRVLNRVEAVMDYALAHKFAQGDNPARVLAALPKQSKIAPVEHLTALPWQEVPAFMSALRGLKSTAARCVEFLILCAARTGEAMGARWDEIDLKAKTWTIPASRMKAGKEQRVPLSPAALEVLSSLPHEGSLVFGGDKVLGETALRRTVLAKLRPGTTRWRSAITTHGFRASFKTWASESTNYAPEIVEVALAHKRGGKVEESYQRGDLFEKRRRLMDAWCKFCSEGAPAAASVVPMRSARRA
jgi:integrase